VLLEKEAHQGGVYLVNITAKKTVKSNDVKCYYFLTTFENLCCNLL